MWSKIRENSEILVSFGMVILLVTCLDPLEPVMPSFWERTVVVLLIALYGLYSGIVFRVRGRDERERIHLAWAERAGFLVGTGLLVLFIILDIFSLGSPKSLILALGGMVLTKLAVLLFLRHCK